MRSCTKRRNSNHVQKRRHTLDKGIRRARVDLQFTEEDWPSKISRTVPVENSVSDYMLDDQHGQNNDQKTSNGNNLSITSQTNFSGPLIKSAFVYNNMFGGPFSNDGNMCKSNGSRENIEGENGRLHAFDALFLIISISGSFRDAATQTCAQFIKFGVSIYGEEELFFHASPIPNN